MVDKGGHSASLFLLYPYHPCFLPCPFCFVCDFILFEKVFYVHTSLLFASLFFYSARFLYRIATTFFLPSSLFILFNESTPLHCENDRITELRLQALTYITHTLHIHRTRIHQRTPCSPLPTSCFSTTISLLHLPLPPTVSSFSSQPSTIRTTPYTTVIDHKHTRPS